MSDEVFDLTEPELDAGDFPVLEDDPFGPETVAVVTDAASGIRRATSVASAAIGLMVAGADIDESGFEETVDDHGSHLNGGDLHWDGGFTTTYE